MIKTPVIKPINYGSHGQRGRGAHVTQLSLIQLCRYVSASCQS